MECSWPEELAPEFSGRHNFHLEERKGVVCFMPKETHLRVILLKSRLFLLQRMEREGILMDMGRRDAGGCHQVLDGW